MTSTDDSGGGFLPFISASFGWIYFTLWSLSFYPQALLNFRRRSTTGTTVDFPWLNVLGFSAYSASNIALYYSPAVRRQYAARNSGLTPTVQFNDVVFALHGLVLSAITASQYLVGGSLWRFPRTTHHHHNNNVNPGARPSRLALGLTAGAFVGVGATALLVLGARSGGRDVDPEVDWCDLDVVYALGYVKIAVTLVKYTPQLLTNIRNQSTEGWSIWQILLDITGGLLSIAQQGIDSYLQHDWSGITSNPVKFGLGQISIFFDLLFILQHYVLYRKKGADGTETERLLPPGEERRLD
ncbi:Cystinosin/ERS1p [Beauveria bassiana ARSEF 2860]|uniref:Cystinosin/ERS1p n=1 Tax=Beauveria bassiana (strain ARSEF 2860) TaxID=655819 RepID=J4UV49_BEAB2|nr:Cystinosin/ERS1p [Beauveria bassiana ARSEF 2860]EJP69967.1 Cystinosin/ERS1p [Beauveria bassiana ARSEF 2860]